MVLLNGARSKAGLPCPRRLNASCDGENAQVAGARRILCGSGQDCADHLLAEPDAGNKCGKCQNHEIETSKKGKCPPRFRPQRAGCVTFGRGESRSAFDLVCNVC